MAPLLQFNRRPFWSAVNLTLNRSWDLLDFVILTADADSRGEDARAGCVAEKGPSRRTRAPSFGMYQVAFGAFSHAISSSYCLLERYCSAEGSHAVTPRFSPGHGHRVVLSGLALYNASARSLAETVNCREHNVSRHHRAACCSRW
jgi:hypothetical protein